TANSIRKTDPEYCHVPECVPLGRILLKSAQGDQGMRKMRVEVEALGRLAYFSMCPWLSSWKTEHRMAALQDSCPRLMEKGPRSEHGPRWNERSAKEERLLVLSCLDHRAERRCKDKPRAC